MTKPLLISKAHPKVGVGPAIALVNPKYARNVGAVIRLASCYGIKQVWMSGNRLAEDPSMGKRLPREERMKGYKEVELIEYDRFLDMFPKDIIPVAVEVRENSEPLYTFEHPENAVYVFGPEDGSIPKTYLQHCHRFLVIPTRHCLNLATAVATILHDRAYKRFMQGKQEVWTPGEVEERGVPNWEDVG
ncbi:TrmH family RNA methyltransferase [Candidatus Parcubacteria bacterium]|nr:MAG: TrmH family RNA methyltransferase [Candidatus Parcubacteria bacterium]